MQRLTKKPETRTFIILPHFGDCEDLNDLEKSSQPPIGMRLGEKLGERMLQIWRVKRITEEIWNKYGRNRCINVFETRNYHGRNRTGNR